MLVVVGVCAIVVFGKLSWPGIGESEKNCCCTTGSTDAATEFVESATFLSTLSAIQSLGATGVSTQIGTRAPTVATLTPRTASKSGMRQMRGRYG